MKDVARSYFCCPETGSLDATSLPDWQRVLLKPVEQIRKPPGYDLIAAILEYQGRQDTARKPLRKVARPTAALEPGLVCVECGAVNTLDEVEQVLYPR